MHDLHNAHDTVIVCYTYFWYDAIHTYPLSARIEMPYPSRYDAIHTDPLARIEMPTSDATLPSRRSRLYVLCMMYLPRRVGMELQLMGGRTGSCPLFNSLGRAGDLDHLCS